MNPRTLFPCSFIAVGETEYSGASISTPRPLIFGNLGHFCYGLVIDGEATLSFMRTIGGGRQGFVSEASSGGCVNVILFFFVLLLVLFC